MNFYNFQESWWENREQTQDESAICEYLESISPLINKSKLLHIGVGSNTLYKRLEHFNKFSITGITVSINEYENALKLHSSSYIVFLLNKYNPSASSIFKLYNFIVDNNPTSYGESKEQDIMYFSYILTHLKKGGEFLTHTLGLSYIRQANISMILEETGFSQSFSYTTNPYGVVILKKL